MEQSTIKPEDITLFRHPLLTIYYFFRITVEYLTWFLRVHYRYYVPIALVITVYCVVLCFPNLHQQWFLDMNSIIKFMLYWIVLGIASSVGLGTGLHTFVLYLGPWIAKFTLAANECGTIPTMVPNKWNFSHFAPCSKASPENLTLFTLYCCVIFESFLWGFGTAIGELPPYMVARLASLTGKRELELEALVREEPTDCLGKMKRVLYTGIRKNAFVVILLCASIPNPLFDLAGLMCGHFLIPFRTFFVATSIGKAMIKVSIQTIFIIVVFSKNHTENLMALIEDNFPSLGNTLSEFLENWKQQFFTPPTDLDKKHWLMYIWEWLVTLMIAYFLISCINSLAQTYAAQIQGEKGKAPINGTIKGKHKAE